MPVTQCCKHMVTFMSRLSSRNRATHMAVMACISGRKEEDVMSLKVTVKRIPTPKSDVVTKASTGNLCG